MNIALNSSILKKVMDHFPTHLMRLTFAYGSGIFQQQHDTNFHKNMLDFIFVVDDPEIFHSENMQFNKNHYSFLRYLGAGNISMIQKRAASVYFNTLIKCENRIMKYGVISTQDLKNDLLDWESLYISGRLHKPVKFVHYDDNDADLSAALTVNLKSAMHTSLLLLDDNFTEEEFFHTITGLSYHGDFRMQFGENKNKINNIVKNNLDEFIKLYEPFLSDDPHLYWNREKKYFEQSQCSSSRYHHLNLLPKMVLQGLVDIYNCDGKSRDTEEVLYSLCHGNSCSDQIFLSVNRIVHKSSRYQSCKNIFTAGLSKSMRYSSKKIYKMLASEKK